MNLGFMVSEECLALGLRAGAMIFRDVSVQGASPALREEIAREAENIRAKFADPREVWSLPEVVSYQEVLRKVGVNPRRVQPSVARLLIGACKSGDLPAINSLVDAYNLVSVRSLLSLGAHDLDRICLPVTLRLFAGGERFTPLGSEQEEGMVAGEFGYVDAAGRVLCRLDVLQADFSKVTSATRNALLIIEGTTTHPEEVLAKAFEEVVERVTRECGGTAEVVAFPGR